MARGWFPRRSSQTSTVATASPATAPSALLPALRTFDALRRQADWEHMVPEERASALQRYALSLERSADPALPAHDPLNALWAAHLVSLLQPRATSVIKTWLWDAAPGGHLLVSGRSGCGRLSLLTALAREAMAQQPLPPDYCYVPDPAALDTYTLLALPADTANAFTNALLTYLRIILDAYWDDLGRRQSPSSGTSEPKDNEGPPPEVLYMQAARDFAPAEAQSYLGRLSETVQAAIELPIRPEIVIPRALASSARRGAASPGAPVVVAMGAGADLDRHLIRANGGILILAADEMARTLDNPTGLWATLRAALRAQRIAPQGHLEPFVPLSVRVAVVGSPWVISGLLDEVPDFARFFRYVAQFEDRVTWTRETEGAYAALAQFVTTSYSLPPFGPGAVAALIENGARRVEQSNRFSLSTGLVTLHDVVVEAGRHAMAVAPADEERAAAVTRADVEAVLIRRQGEQGYAAQLLYESILAGYQNVPTDGAEVGAITGLSVRETFPAEGSVGGLVRHSVTVAPGREERLIDIEREAHAADEWHQEGAMTMIGFLTWRYGASHPISLVARTRGEERLFASGPSASAAELFMVLSALARLPIWRARAVTGMVGQHGDIQSIGGVNEKIEGFWQICQARWNAGERPPHGFGVLIPAVNARDLMLRPEIARVIADQGWFSIWPIRTIDDGLPLLMGVAAGEVHARVARRLREFYEVATALREK